MLSRSRMEALHRCDKPYSINVFGPARSKGGIDSSSVVKSVSVPDWRRERDCSFGVFVVETGCLVVKSCPFLQLGLRTGPLNAKPLSRRGVRIIPRIILNLGCDLLMALLSTGRHVRMLHCRALIVG